MRLIDLDHGRMASTRRLVIDLLDRIEGAATRCGAAAGIDLARAMTERNLPGWYRKLAADSGPAAIVSWAADQAETSQGMEFSSAG